MKNFAYIVFISLAALFTFKSLITLATSSEKYSVLYELNINENESPEESEKADTKEKNFSEEFQSPGSQNSGLLYLILFEASSNQNNQWHYSPYFEIFSPPPERI